MWAWSDIKTFMLSQRLMTSESVPRQKKLFCDLLISLFFALSLSLGEVEWNFFRFPAQTSVKWFMRDRWHLWFRNLLTKWASNWMEFINAASQCHNEATVWCAANRSIQQTQRRHRLAMRMFLSLIIATVRRSTLVVSRFSPPSSRQATSTVKEKL